MSPRQPIPSRGLANSVTAPTTESSDRHLLPENEPASLAPSLAGYPHDLVAESMVTLAQLPPRDPITFFSKPSVSYDLMHVGDSFAALALHEESSGPAGSIAEPPTVLPESHLSVEVAFVSPGPAFARYGGPPSGHYLTIAGRISVGASPRVSPRAPIPYVTWRPC